MKITKIFNLFLLISILLCFLFSCKKDVTTFTNIFFTMQFNETQERLDNIGEPSVIPTGHASQTPEMNAMSVHYIEFSYDEFTPYKDGQIVYKAPETTEGGHLSIDFDSALVASENENFFSFNIRKLPAGTYQYMRVSAAYQNYTVKFNLLNIPVIGNLYNQSGTIASFIGYRTYIRNLLVKNLSIDLHQEKDQGFWAFETNLSSPYDSYNVIDTGQAPVGATTVVNPINATSPVPANSCVITGKFDEPLIITGEEADEEDAKDLHIILSFSTNESFEWIDTNGNGEWDIDASNPTLTEQVVDMGLRGLLPSWQRENE